MAGDKEITEELLKRVLKAELNNFRGEVLTIIQAEIGKSEKKILRVIKTENRKNMGAIANIAVNSPTLSMFKELEQKVDRYLLKN